MALTTQPNLKCAKIREMFEEQNLLKMFSISSIKLSENLNPISRYDI